jgi:hypothetical protein
MCSARPCTNEVQISKSVSCTNSCRRYRSKPKMTPMQRKPPLRTLVVRSQSLTSDRKTPTQGFACPTSSRKRCRLHVQDQHLQRQSMDASHVNAGCAICTPKAVFDISTPSTIQLSYHTFKPLVRIPVELSPLRGSPFSHRHQHISELSVGCPGGPVALLR